MNTHTDTGIPSAAWAVVTDHMTLIERLAGRLAGRHGADADELASAAVEPAFHAAQRWEPDRGTYWSFAIARVRGAMLDTFRDNRRHASLDAPLGTDDDAGTFGDSVRDVRADDPAAWVAAVDALPHLTRTAGRTVAVGTSRGELTEHRRQTAQTVRHDDDAASPAARWAKGNPARLATLAAAVLAELLDVATPKPADVGLVVRAVECDGLGPTGPVFVRHAAQALRRLIARESRPVAGRAARRGRHTVAA